jgi:hypothetical protein
MGFIGERLIVSDFIINAGADGQVSLSYTPRNTSPLESRIQVVVLHEE